MQELAAQRPRVGTRRWAPRAPEAPRARAPEARPALPGAFLSLVHLSLSELRGDAGRLIESGWDERLRGRPLELARALAEACHRQGLADLARIARSLSALAALSRAEALPLAVDLRRKFRELFALAETVLSRQTRSIA